MKIQAITILAILCTSVACWAQSLERAQLYSDHGLLTDAKRECIRIITSSNPEDEKATAYYILGLIAFDENRIGTSLNTWTELTKKYPDSKEATEVSERIKELAQIVGETHRESLDNAVARAYLRHGDFWSRKKDSKLSIDSSWISNVDAAVKWYDTTIAEFPGTAAARIAYEEKMQTLLGWQEPGTYGTAHGIKKNAEKYLPIMIQTFGEYAKAFPESGSLQAFRYQIAQAYWKEEEWQNTRAWLNKIIEKANGQDSFYADVAKRRLQKVEY